MTSLPNLPQNIINNIMLKRLNLLSKNVYNNYQTNNNEIYDTNPLRYLREFFQEKGKHLSKTEKTYVRNKFRKYIIRDQIITKILNIFSNIGNLNSHQQLKEFKKLNTNNKYFETWANPSKWLQNPPKKWVSLWKTYNSL